MLTDLFGQSSGDHGLKPAGKPLKYIVLSYIPLGLNTDQVLKQLKMFIVIPRAGGLTRRLRGEWGHVAAPPNQDSEDWPG